ncbi:hypothetical protein KP78_18300 [Jeotgalibacillus soli]|uniref:Uncharacterized protein n=1 Tax=Jeotgalibacillus soli TaxID=889306 RepID=A0A0C2VE99_9BACL|nr:hypothetical protein KP78_18300 [Jeotgalibacillus soli]
MFGILINKKVFAANIGLKTEKNKDLHEQEDMQIFILVNSHLI